MQAQSNLRMAKQALEERQIGALVALLDYSIEIADRLVEMHPEGEPDRLQLGALREPKPPGDGAKLEGPLGWDPGPDAVEGGLHVERDGVAIELD